MSMQERYKPTDIAPPWTDDMNSERLSKCIMRLLLFGALTESEAKICFQRIDDWVNGRNNSITEG